MTETRADIARRAGVWTFLLAALLVAIKGLAFWLSGSVSVLASLADSVMDVVVSGLNYLAIRYSSKPADEDHRHGHGKIEGLAALGQALLMSLVALGLIAESMRRFLSPEPITQAGDVVALMCASLVISAIIIKVQSRAIRESGSLAIEADHAHYTADVIQHGGVILALIGAAYFGAGSWLDALCAALIAGWMLLSVHEIARKGIDMILDRELPDHERETLLTLIQSNPQVLGVHDLRATRSGMKELIFFDIEADPQMSLHDAHAITRALENEILKLYPGAEIMIHVDPHGEIEDSRHTVAAIHH